MTFAEQVQDVRDFVGAATGQALTDMRYLAEALDATLCLLDTLSHRVATLEQDRGRSE